jgi:hypothetical protein
VLPMPQGRNHPRVVLRVHQRDVDRIDFRIFE